MVAQIERFAILLVPLLRARPGLHAWRMRGRVLRHSATIRAIGEEAAATGVRERLERLAERLGRIDREVAGLSPPLPRREFASTARPHIDLVRQRLAEAQDAEAGR